ECTRSLFALGAMDPDVVAVEHQHRVVPVGSDRCDPAFDVVTAMGGDRSRQHPGLVTGRDGRIGGGSPFTLVGKGQSSLRSTDRSIGLFYVGCQLGHGSCPPGHHPATSL